MQGEGGGEEGEDADLHGGIVEDGFFGAGVSAVAVAELVADGKVADCYCYSASEDKACVHDYVCSDVG